MIRTVGGVIILILAVLYFPLWVQLVLFATAVVLVPYRVVLLVPAIVSDALYAPEGVWHLTAHWMALIVAALLGIHWYVMKKMRVQHVYGLEA